MRMLTLCTLGDAQPELTYATVQQQLQVILPCVFTVAFSCIVPLISIAVL